MKTSTSGWITVKEAAGLSGYSEWRIRHFCRQGVLKASKRLAGPGGGKNTRILIKRDDLDAFIGARPGGGM